MIVLFTASAPHIRQQELQAGICLRWCYRYDFSSHDILRNERVVADPFLKLGQRGSTRQNHPSSLWLEAAGQVKNAVVETALQPIFVRLHQLSGLIAPG